MSTPAQIAFAIFDGIRESFPDLVMRLDESPEFVDLELEISEQSGLSFPVSLNLQNNDELHIEAPDFWVEWFPCADSDVVARYIQAVSGLLDGTYRIVHYRRGERLLKARLEKPSDAGWKPVAHYYRGFSILLLPSLFCERSAVQNVAAVQQSLVGDVHR